ncbi:hypothetical protein FEF33_13540 (plasmid) [Moraxella osloensis]|jgi:hypothetical protein|uniref:Uncharacterized protein n=1 Tax=Faucicola osloensis TaxID=34062 RepID=A0AAW6TFJ1_FAUOS|nr:hypothetical protein [Moraxella osloensis]MDI4510323.1 hypothetical protein [Moraxella osloensis]QCR87021.1 hypothetical protein FEF33_13540 [Moraxella osloensis]
MSLIISELLCKLDHQTQVAEKAFINGCHTLADHKEVNFRYFEGGRVSITTFEELKSHFPELPDDFKNIIIQEVCHRHCVLAVGNAPTKDVLITH